MMDVDDPLGRDFSAAFERAMTRIMGREPRYRYFQRGSGPMFFWTVEKAGDGRYHSGVYEPVGKGSRSNRATAWRLDDDQYSRHALRKDAKARALRLFREWKASQQ
jgi:hypothetical protein